jgi:hypothetical protein
MLCVIGVFFCLVNCTVYCRCHKNAWGNCSETTFKYVGCLSNFVWKVTEPFWRMLCSGMWRRVVSGVQTFRTCFQDLESNEQWWFMCKDVLSHRYTCAKLQGVASRKTTVFDISSQSEARVLIIVLFVSFACLPPSGCNSEWFIRSTVPCFTPVWFTPVCLNSPCYNILICAFIFSV